MYSAAAERKKVKTSTFHNVVSVDADPLKNRFQNPLAVANSDLQKSSGPLADFGIHFSGGSGLRMRKG